MSYTNRSDPKQNPWYPRHVSDRADELLAEIDEERSRRLYDALRTTSVSEWLAWLEDQREAIATYDGLSRTQRKRRLQDPDDVSALRLQHACVFVELWRSRLATAYLPLPPHGRPLETAHSQRELLLAALASYWDYPQDDLWPFDVPEGKPGLPFRKSD